MGVTSTVLEGKLTASDGLRLDIKIRITDKMGDADAVAKELEDLLNTFIDGYDDDGDGERVDTTSSSKVVDINQFRKTA